jgi:hypothetical protein
LELRKNVSTIDKISLLVRQHHLSWDVMSMFPVGSSRQIQLRIFALLSDASSSKGAKADPWQDLTPVMECPCHDMSWQWWLLMGSVPISTWEGRDWQSLRVARNFNPGILVRYGAHTCHYRRLECMMWRFNTSTWYNMFVRDNVSMFHDLSLKSGCLAVVFFKTRL